MGGSVGTNGGAQAITGGAQQAGQGGTGANGGSIAQGGSVAGGQAGSGGDVGRDQTYEGEEAFSAGSGAVVASADGVTGTGYVDALQGRAARLVFAVNAAADGPSEITLRARHAAARTVAVYVNGDKALDADLPVAAAFADQKLMLTLRAGLNTIALVNEDATVDAISIDHLKMTGGAGEWARGAIVPFVEYEAEDGETNASKIGPDTKIGTLAANASGRRAVTLDGAGKYVEWTLSAPASGISLRYSLPDAPAGGGVSGSVSLYVDGKKRQTLALSSKNAWVYDPYPFGNDPSTGVASRLFSEDRFVIGEVPVGAKLRLQRDADDATVTIDLLDAEPVPEPYAQPAGSISLLGYGAIADDDADDAPALAAAVAAASAAKKTLFIPKGRFVLGSRVDVANVTIRGAGPWHSVFQGKANRGGLNGTGNDVKLLDFAIFGDIDHRDDSYDAGVDGSLGSGSLIQNLWIQSTKVGIWLVKTDGAYVVGSRIRDTYADGVNLNVDATHTAVEHVHVRNTGDDGLAIWAKGSSESNRFKWCSVQLPYHASAIAIYGGSNNSVEKCVVADTVRNGAGIQVGTRHDPIALAGTTRVLECEVNRAGSLDEPNANWFGAIWLFADTKPIDAPVVVKDVKVMDATYDGIHFTGANPIQQVVFDGDSVTGAGKSAVHIETAGKGTFNHVTVVNAALPSVVSQTFDLTRGDGNTGW